MGLLRPVVAACLLSKGMAEFYLRNELFHHKDMISLDVPDPTVGESTIASAIADSKALYESLQEDYIREKCLESWGEFPSATTTTTSSSASNNKPYGSNKNHTAKPGSVCKCGLLYDSAASIVGLEQEGALQGTIASSDASAASAALDTNPSIASTLDAWLTARIPKPQATCSGGTANVYPCKNVDLIAHFPLASLSIPNSPQGAPQFANDVWGWTSLDGSDREFVIWGVREGCYFFEVTTHLDQPVVLGFLPDTNGDHSFWRDMKVVGNYAFLGSESLNHGIQIFNMRKLLTIHPKNDCVSDKYCLQLSWDRVYFGTSEFRALSSHNLVANEESGFVYAVGGNNGCWGGLHVVDVSNPLNPTNAGCFDGDGYVHDAQCVIYKGKDLDFTNSEICFSFNADTVTIVDVTNKSNMVVLSRTSYQNVQFTHQGWVSSDHSHIIFGDEVDELRGLPLTRTLVINIEDLRKPTNVQTFTGTTAAIDHNQYVVKATAEGQDYNSNLYNETDLIYQANYQAGLRILQVVDYETAEFVEVGFFDIEPFANGADFDGAWSTFPYFKSGLVAISGTKQGLFLVKPNLESSLIPPPGRKDCTVDRPLKFKIKRKNCDWVGKVKVGKPKATRLRTRRRCRKIYNGEPLSSWCWKTCGNVGLGACSHLDPKTNK